MSDLLSMTISTRQLPLCPFFWPCCAACRILVPNQGSNPGPQHREPLDHWGSPCARSIRVQNDYAWKATHPHGPSPLTLVSSSVPGRPGVHGWAAGLRASLRTEGWGTEEAHSQSGDGRSCWALSGGWEARRDWWGLPGPD